MHRLLQLTLDFFDPCSPRFSSSSTGPTSRSRTPRAQAAPTSSRRLGRPRRGAPSDRAAAATRAPSAIRDANREAVLGDVGGRVRIPARQAPQHRLPGRARRPDGERAQAGCRCTRWTRAMRSKSRLDRATSWTTRTSASERLESARIEWRDGALSLPRRTRHRGAGSAPRLRRSGAVLHTDTGTLPGRAAP